MSTRAILAELFSHRWVRWLFAFLTITLTLGYSMVLPAATTGRIRPSNWSHLDLASAGFSAAFGVGMAVSLTVQAYALRRHSCRRARRQLRRGQGAVAGVAATVTVAPALLSGLASTLGCCGPLLPTSVAAAASATAVGIGQSGAAGLFARQPTRFLAGGLVLLTISCYWSLRRAQTTGQATVSRPLAVTAGASAVPPGVSAGVALAEHGARRSGQPVPPATAASSAHRHAGPSSSRRPSSVTLSEPVAPGPPAKAGRATGHAQKEQRRGLRHRR